MCAEDVRSEGIRNKEKYEKGQEVIAHLQAVIEMHVKTAQADKLKGQRERETLEMNLQDYETHLRKIQGENTQIREKLRQTGEDLQVEKNEIFRYQKEYEETPFISHGTQTTAKVEMKDNFSQMVNNKPLPRFTQVAQQTLL